MRDGTPDRMPPPRVRGPRSHASPSACTIQLIVAGPRASTLKPALQAILLCDHLYLDKATGKFVIAGTFTRISAAAFPALHPLCFLYARLVDWQGKGALRARLVDLTDQSQLGEVGPIPAEISDRLTGAEIGIQLPPLPLPHSGAYAIELLWGDANEYLGAWRFEAQPIPKGPQ